MCPLYSKLKRCHAARWCQLSLWQKWAQQLVSRHAFGHGAEPVCWQQWTHRQMREEACQTITGKRFWLSQLCSLSHPPHCQPPYCEVQHSADNGHASDSSFKPRCLVEVMVSFSPPSPKKEKTVPRRGSSVFFLRKLTVCVELSSPEAHPSLAQSLTTCCGRCWGGLERMWRPMAREALQRTIQSSKSYIFTAV